RGGEGAQEKVRRIPEGHRTRASGALQRTSAERRDCIVGFWEVGTHAAASGRRDAQTRSPSACQTWLPVEFCAAFFSPETAYGFLRNYQDWRTAVSYRRRRHGRCRSSRCRARQNGNLWRSINVL